VLSNPLCFLVNKFGKDKDKLLKTVLMDFYDPDDLAMAKQQLLKDIESAKTGITFPHIPQQRQGENRAVRTVEDMFTLITMLDQNKSLDILPVYVASGPDRLPSLRLYDGELNALMIMLERMQRKVEEYGSALSAITGAVSTLQAKLLALERPGSITDEDFPLLQSSSVKPRQAQRQSHLQPRQQHSAVAVQGNSGLTSIDQDTTVPKATVDWAAMVSTPTANRYAALALTTDEEDELRPFEDVQSRKRRRNRTSPPQVMQQQSLLPRQQSQQQHSLTSKDNTQPQQQKQQSRRRPPVLGKSTALNSIAAANKVKRRKAVYCIDNVDVAYTADDIKRFVSAQSIEVVSCFETKPRRRRYDVPGDPIVDRRAFRLCIYYDDCKRLLDSSIWPDSLLIYEWFFKSQQSSVADQSKRQCLDSNAVDFHDTAAAVQANMDSTILAAEITSADSEVNVNTDLNNETVTVVNIDDNTISNNGVDDSSC